MKFIEKLDFENENGKITQCDCCGKMKGNCTTMFVYGLETNACQKCRSEYKDLVNRVADRGDWLYHTKDRD